MPNRTTHETQALHNDRFWQSLDVGTTPYTDWIVNGIFYSAVHWIEAYLATINRHSSSHANRSTIMNGLSRLRRDPDLIPDYVVLRTESENARYVGRKYTAEEITADLIPALNRIRQTMLGLIA